MKLEGGQNILAAGGRTAGSSLGLTRPAHRSMITQALKSEKVRNGLLVILLGQALLYETLKETVEE